MSEPPANPVASQPVLRARGLTRSLGEGAARNQVLRGVDLELYRGRVYAVVGPSGCGKSTLLYLLGLLDRPDAGQIWLRGEEVAAASDEQRTAARSAALGFVFQFHFLLPEFSALENVLLPMRKKASGSVPQQTVRAQSLLDAVGLGDKAQRRANQLSGGEQQRVAIARALANQPDLVLADEPTGNLDARNSERVFVELKQLAAAGQQAVLIVTHNPQLAAQCDVVLSMCDGQFVAG
jgi:lipoprotein-releasing system ATP-binding protein